MCGIIGYLGIKKASPILLAGLNRLEYRGYDSAGISTVETDGIHVVKDKGRVKNLESIPEINTLEGTVGIAHTRWATHGKPSKENAHPHQDNSKTFSVVHNGIIENYSELKNLLLENGYHFFSDTDTEIIPNLIHYYYMKELELDSDKTVQKFLRAVRDCCSDLKGSFALEVICSDFPHNMIVVRKDSPLVIGTCDDEKYISSDIPAILSYTRDFYLLEYLEFVVLDNKSATFIIVIWKFCLKKLAILNGMQLLVKKMVMLILCLRRLMNSQLLLERQLVQGLILVISIVNFLSCL